jgi:hypothetical protein
MSHLQGDIRLQQRGIVSVGYTIGYPTFISPQRVAEYATKFHMIRDGLPLKRSAFHFCNTNSTMKPMIVLFRTLAGPEFRMRFRDHYGTNTRRREVVVVVAYTLASVLPTPFILCNFLRRALIAF